MKNLIPSLSLLVGLALLFGCDPPTKATPPAASMMTAPPVGEGPPGRTAVVPPESVPKPDDQAKNPNRVNQLKDLKQVEVKAAGVTVHAWVMDNESKREEGMMFLTSNDVKENQGMIFVFPIVQASRNAFWMHNCPLGLDIIYIDAKNRVINVGDGKPQNDNQVPATADYKWVLEVRRGWAKRHGLKHGDKVVIPSGLATNE